MNKKIYDMLYQSEETLKEIRMIFAKIHNNPELILTKLFSNKLRLMNFNYPFLVFNTSEDKEVTYHTVQRYIFNILINYLKEKYGKKFNYIYDNMYFPANIIVRSKNNEIVEIDIYNKTIKEIEVKNRKNYKYIMEIYWNNKEISEYKKDLIKWEDYYECPWRAVKDIKLFFRLFYDFDNYKKEVKNVIEKINRILESKYKDIKKLENKLEECDLLEKELQEKSKYLLDIFVKNYEFKII